MNDLAEVRQGWDFIREWLDDQPDNDGVLNSMRQVVENERTGSQFATTFMCSASKQRDDANQWRLYANTGRGYAVELDASVRLAVKALGERAHPALTGTGQPSWETLILDSAFVSPWLEVLYENSAKVRALDGLAANARFYSENLPVKSSTYEEFGEATQQFQADLSIELATIAQIMKSPGFAGENEIRTVVSFAAGDDHVLYRETDYGVVGYVRLGRHPAPRGEGAVVYPSEHREHKELQRLPIRSVGLGPLLSAQNNRVTVERLMQRAGHPNSVWDSKIPLR
ncbi:DUF2971 domain-containing protein [Promicromonospora sp. NPDC090134]|uniref:DUF2971 domain-containing protein n=1 Tax=Promicromonospora sp. NPDC090134 TaxID=3364408 RepID=UPI0037FD4BD1